MIEVALSAAQESTGNARLTADPEVDSETAIAIGMALGDEFSVDIGADSIQEWAGSKVRDFVEYMELLGD